MARKVESTQPTVDPFVREVTMTLTDGRQINRGDQITVRRIGKAKFRSLVTNPGNGVRWVDVLDGRGRMRSVTTDEVGA